MKKVSQRKPRAKIACTRCRQRKIRCSGDPRVMCGSCHKAAVHECNFVRVKSLDPHDGALKHLYLTIVKSSTPVPTTPGDNSMMHPSLCSSSPSDVFTNGDQYPSVIPRPLPPSLAINRSMETPHHMPLARGADISIATDVSLETSYQPPMLNRTPYASPIAYTTSTTTTASDSLYSHTYSADSRRSRDLPSVGTYYSSEGTVEDQRRGRVLPNIEEMPVAHEDYHQYQCKFKPVPLMI